MAIVTISRGTMSGGEDLAHLLSEKLGLPAISREVIAEAASLHGISEAALAEHMDKKFGIMKQMSSDRRLYLVAIQCALAERAKKGGFVYHGHAGHLLLKDIHHVFKVRLIAPMRYRIERLMKNQNMSEEDAEKYIKDVDKRRIQWTKFLYDVDLREPALYDVIINLGWMSIDTAAVMIIRALEQPEFKRTDESKKYYDDFAFACQVKSKVALDERTRGMEVEVKADQGNVSIIGHLFSSGPFRRGIKRSREELIEVVQSVPGVKEVQLEFRDTSTPVE